MNKSLIFFMLLLLCQAAGGQQFYRSSGNPDMMYPSELREPHRKEIFIPQVNGYNVYKADLHTHSVYSDGSVLPKYRVAEAWQDGLDIMAVTEHVEYRPNEAEMVKYLEKYTDKKHKKAVNYKIGDGLTKEGIMVDLNTSVVVASKVAKSYGITIIPGLEITRDAGTIGHLNALFTTDNNLIYDPDPYQAVLNARAQGALIQHNHPGWRRNTVDFSEWQRKVYDEGLVDGVEVVNGEEIYPAIVDRCVERGLFISANTDVHGTTGAEYRAYGVDRPMTLVFAKDKSLESVRESLESQRTLAFAYGNVWGADKLLKGLFLACVKVTNVDGRKYLLTNQSSVPYVIQKADGSRVHLDPFTSISVVFPKDGTSLNLTIMNMWNGTESHPTVEISVK